MKRGLVSCSTALALLFGATATAPDARADHHEHTGAVGLPRTASAEGASVYIISPHEGDEVSSPLVVRFGLRGMGVAPAGVAAPDTGHHHLILDAPTPALDAVLPNDAHHLHFGKGQTETTLELAPGEHTLQLVLGDQNHVPHDPPLVSERIRIRVR